MPNSFLYNYVPMGLTDIAVIENSFEESEAGYGSHKATETIAARRANSFVKMSVCETATFGFGAKRRFWIDGQKEITEDEYNQLCAGKAFIDTPEVVKSVKEHNAAVAKHYDLEHKLDEMAPKCPQCGNPTVRRSGPYGPFWGCLKYPNCRGTVNMSADELAAYKEWAGEK